MQSFIETANVYSADCPTRWVLDRVADKWTVLIIILLKERPQRFSELQRAIEGISQKMLTQTLRILERDGLVNRKVYAEVPPRVEYTLTALGETIYPPLLALSEWAENNISAVSAAQQNYDAR